MTIIVGTMLLRAMMKICIQIKVSMMMILLLLLLLLILLLYISYYYYYKSAKIKESHL